jgi:hypothetical protein
VVERAEEEHGVKRLAVERESPSVREMDAKPGRLSGALLRGFDMELNWVNEFDLVPEIGEPFGVVSVCAANIGDTCGLGDVAKNDFLRSLELQRACPVCEAFGLNI